MVLASTPIDFFAVPSPGFSVFTPQTVRSSVSPSPSLNFQSLSLTEQVPSGQFDLLPTIEEEVTDNDGVQVNTENDASSVSTWASTLVTDNQIFSDEIYQHRTLYVAWQNAVTRQHVPYAELMDHRRHPIGYRDQNVYIWSCVSTSNTLFLCIIDRLTLYTGLMWPSQGNANINRPLPRMYASSLFHVPCGNSLGTC